MKNNLTLYILLIVILSISCSPEREKNAVSGMLIHTGWQYKKVGDSSWSQASVPGCIHTDLLNDSKIEDPFYRLNEKKQQWIGETDWEYRTTFEVSSKTMSNENIALVFDGLDTYADVFLNDNHILSADNMFRTWDVNVKSQLKQGTNELRVYFHNVFKVNQPKYDSADFELQAWPNNDQADVKLNLYSRKAGFHYGWDWGPRLITAGIWRPIRLKSWSDIKIDNVYYRQHDVTAERAKIAAEMNISADREMKAVVSIKQENIILAEKELTLSKGKNKVAIPFIIDSPKLWWTNGLGGQPLYTFESSVRLENGTIDKNIERIGIRSIEVMRDDDKFGKSLYVKLNGVPVFMKGANYIPQDNFQNRVKPDRYEHIIGSAKAANMNMLRVWGGGIYEEDLFYQLCDENGLLVWQDIMFACGMYPADENFLDNVKNEVIDNVTRLRNHPSVALYCGNNENEISWHEWGWKYKYDEQTQKKYEANLKQLFYKTIPEAISIADPDRYYHPSSPIAGIGKDRPKGDGDTHYWGVWHGKEPFANFDQNVSRFVSEYGFQSYPSFSSIKKFSIEEDWDLESDVMHAHQRCMADDRKDIDYGNRLINTYLERNFKTPKNFENYVYTVQALQAKGVKMAIESHRRNRTDNYCMGTMYWQIDDCWPVASWSSIDYYGKWKALHYFVKKAYAPILPTYKEEDGELGIYIVSDELVPIVNASLEVEILDFYGNQVSSSTENITIESNSSIEYVAYKVVDLLKGQNRDGVYVKTTIKSRGEKIGENRHFFEKERNLKLPKAKIEADYKPVEGGYEIHLSSKMLSRYVMISFEGLEDVFLSDNYFDIDGGSKVTILAETKAELEVFTRSIKIISLTDSHKEDLVIASSN